MTETVESWLLKPMIQRFYIPAGLRGAPSRVFSRRDHEGTWDLRADHPLFFFPLPRPLRCGSWLVRRPVPALLPVSPELQQIMRGTQQFPLTGTGDRAATHTPVTAPGTLDLSEHRLHSLAALLVEAATACCQQHPLHAVAARQPLRRAAVWRLAALAAPCAASSPCSGPSTTRALPDPPPAG